MSKERDGRRAGFGVGIQQAGASLCEVFFLAQKNLLALAGPRVPGQVALGPIHDDEWCATALEMGTTRPRRKKIAWRSRREQ